MKYKSILILASVYLAACAIETDNNRFINDDELVEPAKTVTFLSDEGDQVDVHLLDDNMVLISGVIKADSKYATMFDGARKREIDLSTLFKEMTGELVVPEDLVEIDEIYQRSQNKRSVDNGVQQEEVRCLDPLADTFGDGSENETYKTRYINDGSRPENISVTAFNNWCDALGQGFEHDNCMVNRTGSCYYARYLGMVSSGVCVYRGTAKHKLRKKLAGSYSGLINNPVPAGYCSSFTAASNGMQDYLKVEVAEADGDGYHFSYNWSDWF